MLVRRTRGFAWLVAACALTLAMAGAVRADLSQDRTPDSRPSAGASQAPAPARPAPAPPATPARLTPSPVDTATLASSDRALIQKYCLTCHNARAKTGNLSLDGLDPADAGQHAEVWEKVVRKLRGGMMPPQGMPRPDVPVVDAFASRLELALDRHAARSPDPGHKPVHRLNRTEYGNAIRDLLDLEIDPASLLPADDESNGFDNIAGVLRVSPSLLEQYLGAARQISSLAVGSDAGSNQWVFRVPPDTDQADHVEGLPLGTRGGLLIEHNFPQDAEYDLSVLLLRNIVGYMIGLEFAHQLEISVDGERVFLTQVGGEEDNKASDENMSETADKIDARLKTRIRIAAGPRKVAVTFIQRNDAESDEPLQPHRRDHDLQNMNGLPRIEHVKINGPFATTGPGDTPSRRRIFACRPTAATAEAAPASAKASARSRRSSPAIDANEDGCAQKILSGLGRRAYRRPVTAADMEPVLEMYKAGRAKGGFEAGIESGLRLILANPKFLFRTETQPAAGQLAKVSDLELASRLSFFLWSSVPDDELLTVAAAGRLSQPAVLRQQVRRMLADKKSRQLVENFAGQWLLLRNLRGHNPNGPDFPDWDNDLREAFRTETELFFGSIVREDRSVLDLLNGDYTFVNERLAKHYGIPGVYGSHFRRVTLPGEERRGLLGQGSILTVTSYPNRTSPVLRGKWILENITGTPPPPPPPNVPALEENDLGVEARSVRERLEAHRRNPTCATCHRVMDPLGFALENFDGIGQWRVREPGGTVDPSGQLGDGTKVDGPVALRKALSRRPEQFVRTLTEKMLTYGLGRGVDYQDMPTVRAIAAGTAEQGYRMSALILGIVRSPAFQMKKGPMAGRIAGGSGAVGRHRRTDTRRRRGTTMFITKKHLARRAFLRGMGVTVALPFLESMVPARTLLAQTAAMPGPRLGFVYVPHGAIMAKWTPAAEGMGFEFTPILKPLEPFRDRLNVVTGLGHRAADTTAVHSLSPTTWLSGVRPKATQGVDAYAGVTVDQIAAEAIGQDTVLPSMELATEDHSGLIGSCDRDYGCIYMNTLSWRTPTTPLPMEINPRKVFERMFGQGGSATERAARIQEDKSILDLIKSEAAGLQLQLGASDRQTMTQYLDNVREIERRIQRAENSQGDERLLLPERPVGVPFDYEEHIGLMYELLALAFQSNVTRVASFMVAREISNRTYLQVGVPDGHHAISHHQNRPEKMEKNVKIQTYHTTLFSRFLEKLRSTPDGDGTLLDNSVILYGSNMSNSNAHDHFPLPNLVVGGAAGRLKGGRHLRYPDHTPMANLLVSLLDKAGVKQEQVGDSTGPLVSL